MPVQRWDFGNIKKHSKDPNTDLTGCTAQNLPAFQINIPINGVFWDPPFPIPFTYVPIIPPTANIFYYLLDHSTNKFIKTSRPGLSVVHVPASLLQI
ncbi:8087_t:CDS:2 [Cetraspora pellucida]|uniref:8087_t:CDS:1 n=1 Tax=Cetraspora pellucida TaxID=1433469 RepID=A0ACA9JWH3_9GLOM|nr:8087_t:CDS:2 [Cetraspora pellucida]